MDESKIKVSIIVPVYNTQKYLPKTLDSLINQTLKEIEIIIVNDCSPDDSESILLDYQCQDNRIVYIKHQKNKGPGGARNSGIDKARGEYIGFVDSDDWVDEKMYEVLHQKMQEYSADIVQCELTLEPSLHTTSILKTNVLLLQGRKEVLNQCFRSLDNQQTVWALSMPKLYNRKLFNKTRYLDDIYYEDLEILPRLLFEDVRLLLLNEPFYHYLERGTSITQSGAMQKKAADYIIAVKSVLTYLNNHGLHFDHILQMCYGYLAYLLSQLPKHERKILMAHSIGKSVLDSQEINHRLHQMMRDIFIGKLKHILKIIFKRIGFKIKY